MPVSETTSGLQKRRRIVMMIAVGALALSGTGAWAATLVKSPEQVAAEAGAPERDVLTAPVERRKVTDTLVTRGTVSASQTTDITPTVSAGENAGRPVVTKVMVQPRKTFQAGRVLVEVAGRPLFALKGALPVYRDLKPGSHGDDVKQLQRALRALGHGGNTDASGFYGPGTKAAVEDFYASVGYDPVLADGAGGNSVATAREQVKTAQRALADLLAASEKDTRQISYAREDLADAKTSLTEAEAVSGPMVPASEVVFLNDFPARVDTLTAKVGGIVSEKLMTVSAGQLIVNGSLTVNEKDLVRPGQKVKILSETTGSQAEGTVTSVAASPSVEEEADDGKSALDGGGYAVVAQPDKPLPAELIGQDVRLTIEAASSAGQVLVIPVSAISASADATTTVTVLEGDGRLRRVEVRPGMTGDGYAEITPLRRGALVVGDKVVVGVASSDSGGGLE